MFIIADNLTTRNPQVERLFQKLEEGHWKPGQEPAHQLQDLARRCLAAGANALELNTQQHHDRPQALEGAVRLIQESSDCQLCLSSNDPITLEAGLRACKRFPIVNYVSLNPDRLSAMLPMAARYGAEVVLLVSDPTAPTDAREMVGKAAVLLGAAREVGIPADRVYLDPGIIHVTKDVGQRHIVEVREFLASVPEAFDFPVRTTGWLGNASSGAPPTLRPSIEAALLTVLATLGLSSVFMNVLQPENARAARLLKVLSNETIYSDADVELKLV